MNVTRKGITVLCAAASIVMSSCIFKIPEAKVPPSIEGMELLWYDEFDYTGVPDTSKWKYQVGSGGWGNNEVQYYTDNSTAGSNANAYVSNDTLKIEAVKNGSSWTSARMNSRESWKNCYIEIRAKIPMKQGTWPALWMMPQSSVYGGWPASGEIDIMEHSWITGYQKVFSTLHRAAGYGGDGYGIGSRTFANASTVYHTYALDWTEDKMQFFYDGEYIGQYLKSGGTGSAWWPFDQEFYLIMNIAMGGNLGGTIPSTTTSDIMEIDWVRVYQRTK